MFSIGVVARQTGIEISTLRKWKFRYRFPQPARKNSGQRYFSESEIATLLQIGSRILSLGDQPSVSPRESSENVTLSDAKKARLAALDALYATDFVQLKQLLEKSLSERSLLTYIEEVTGPLTELVGEQWAKGNFPSMPNTYILRFSKAS